MSNFVKLALENGGSIHPLVIPASDLKGPALTNPSIYNDNGKVIVNVRNINYTLYHSEKKRFEHPWGPLVYIHPENDLRLRTWNYMCEMDENMRIKSHSRIDTSKFPDKELWEFVGLEDCRIVRWDGKLYICGVRRDLDTIGTGRMELSEIEFTENGVKEISHHRIPTPGANDSYCEKNWMPILDMPYHFVKWTNGTEVVRYDIETGTCEQVALVDWKDLGCIDLRGGSQVIPVGEYRFALTHETFLFRSQAGRKDGTYRHRFVVWDKDWNIVKVSPQFSFMNGEIEFAVGMCEYGNDYLMTFGFQDNAAYLLRAPKDFVLNYIFEKDKKDFYLQIEDNQSNQYSEKIKYAYENINQSNLPDWVLKINGMSGRKYRKFINQLISNIENPKYLEIGCWKGSTTCSALWENQASSLCIDNWVEFGGPKNDFIENVKKCLNDKSNFNFIEEDFKTIEYDSLGLGKFNVFLFDGPHEEQDQYDGVVIPYSLLEDEFIFICDDWNWERVRFGTFRAFNDMNTQILYSLDIRTTPDNSYPKAENTFENSDWHNGYFIAACKK